jgi:hypothetical protein
MNTKQIAIAADDATKNVGCRCGSESIFAVVVDS